MAECAECTGVCTTWTEAVDVQCAETFDAAVLEDAVALASDWLYFATGRQFPGCCQTVVRPCPRVHVTDADAAGWLREAPSTGAWGWLRGGSRCAHGERGGCGSCAGPVEISLGLEPVREVVEVVVDGVVLPVGSYAVLDYSRLVRTDGGAWPRCNDLTIESGPGAWSVEFTYGRRPPRMGAAAARVLACEVARALTPSEAGAGDCALPPNVQALVRQGVTLTLDQDAAPATTEGWLTGLWLPDRFIRTYNAAGLSRGAEVFSPDVGRAARVVTG